MNGIPDLSYEAVALSLLLLLIPLAASILLKLRLTGESLLAAGRMVFQLVLVGFYLEYLFDLNNPFANIGWFIIMLSAACFSVIRHTEIKFSLLFTPAFISFLIANVMVLLYLNVVVIDLENVFEAKYIIAIGGMLLGNSMRGNIIGIGDFYRDLRKDEQLYQYYLSLGAAPIEAAMPFMRKSLRAAIKPSLANMATMGLVSLPGMMTGQILGGVTPITAIKYQIAIVAAIYASTVLSIVLTIFLSSRFAFNEFGMMRKEIYKNHTK